MFEVIFTKGELQDIRDKAKRLYENGMPGTPFYLMYIKLWEACVILLYEWEETNGERSE